MNATQTPAATQAPAPREIDGFKVTRNAFDVRIECATCHASKAGSLAYAWAGSHAC